MHGNSGYTIDPADTVVRTTFEVGHGAVENVVSGALVAISLGGQLLVVEFDVEYQADAMT